jgi:hypothetical protein
MKDQPADVYVCGYLSKRNVTGRQKKRESYERVSIICYRSDAITRNRVRMPAHKDRTAAVNEVHARPHLLITSPQTLLQFAFTIKATSQVTSGSWLSCQIVLV